MRVNQKEMGLILSSVFGWFEALNLLQFSLQHPAYGSTKLTVNAGGRLGGINSNFC